MNNADLILVVGIVFLALGSFGLGLAVGQLPRGGRRKGRHAKGKGRHAK